MKKLLWLLPLLLIAGLVNAQSAQDDIAKLFNTTSTSAETTDTTNTATTNTTTDTTTNDDASHWAAEINLDNTSYVNNNNGTYTLSWSPVVGNAKVEISVKNNDLNEDFSTVAKVSASDGRVNVTLGNAWNYTVKLLPVDEVTGLPVGTEIRKSIKVEWTVAPTPTPTPENPTPTPVVHTDKPQVWADTNLMFGMILIAIIWYVVFRFRNN